MSEYLLKLKGEVYCIRKTHMPKIQEEIRNLDREIEDMKITLSELQKQKKELQVELLNERQLIIYENKDEDKRTELLRKYDFLHGEYRSDSVGWK